VFSVRWKNILTYFLVLKEIWPLRLPLHFPILVYFNHLMDYEEICHWPYFNKAQSLTF
jgi:hypothetical protein